MKKYYVYFITPEPKSEFIKFGKSENLGGRFIAYKTSSPNPQIVGLIEFQTRAEMNAFEKDIQHNWLQDAIYRGEWLYHTCAVKKFYQTHTNVNDIETHLLTAIRVYRQNPKTKEYYTKHRQTPEYKAKMSKQRQDPEYKERQREYQKAYRENKQAEQRKQRRTPEYRERRKEYYAKVKDTPEYKEKSLKQRQDPEYKERQREYQKAYRKRPEYKERRRERMNDPEYKERRNKRRREQYHARKNR